MKHRFRLAYFWWEDCLYKLLLTGETLLWVIAQGLMLDFLNPWTGLQVLLIVIFAVGIVCNSTALYTEIIHKRGWYTPITFIGFYSLYLLLLWTLGVFRPVYWGILSIPGCFAPKILAGFIRRKFRIWEGDTGRYIVPYGIARRYYQKVLKKMK